MTPKNTRKRFDVVYVGDRVHVGPGARVVSAPAGATHTIEDEHIMYASPGLHHAESDTEHGGHVVYHREVLTMPNLTRRHGDKSLVPSERSTTYFPHPCPGPGEAPMIHSPGIIGDPGDQHSTTRTRDEIEGILRSVALEHPALVARTTATKPLPGVSLQLHGGDYGQ